MSAFQKLMAATGLGGATLFLRMQELSLYPGDEATVMLKLRGGDVAQNIETLTLALVKVKSQSGGSTYNTLETFVAASNFTIEPNAVEQYTWTFRVPEVRSVDSYYIIRAEADILHAVNPRDWVKVSVEMNREYETIMDAMKQMGFVCISDWRTNYRSEYHALFTPPKELNEQLQTAELWLVLQL